MVFFAAKKERYVVRQNRRKLNCIKSVIPYGYMEEARKGLPYFFILTGIIHFGVTEAAICLYFLQMP